MSWRADIATISYSASLLDHPRFRKGDTAERRSRRWRCARRQMIAISARLRRAQRLHYVETDDGMLKPAGVLEWARWFETHPRHVADDYVGDLRVSTVFIGLDHGSFGGGSPVLWESMIFRDGESLEMQRYAAREEAERGHAELLARVRSGEFDLAPVVDEEA
jgi:hypothetical protein